MHNNIFIKQQKPFNDKFDKEYRLTGSRGIFVEKNVNLYKCRKCIGEKCRNVQSE